MGLFSSFFWTPPLWHQAWPQHVQFNKRALIDDLESLRQAGDFEYDQFVLLILNTRTVMVRNLRAAYREAQQSYPNHPKSAHFMIVMTDRLTKKAMVQLHDPSPGAVPAHDLTEIIGNLVAITSEFSTIDDAIEFLTEIDEREGRFDDPWSAKRAIDVVCSGHRDAL